MVKSDPSRGFFQVSIFTSAVNVYLADKPHGGAVAASAAVHGYTAAFWWSATLFLVGTLIAATVLRRRPATRSAELPTPEYETT